MNTRAAKRRELGAFLFLMIVAAPVLAFVLVGGYGLVVWIWQIINGRCSRVTTTASSPSPYETVSDRDPVRR